MDKFSQELHESLKHLNAKATFTSNFRNWELSQSEKRNYCAGIDKLDIARRPNQHVESDIFRLTKLSHGPS